MSHLLRDSIKNAKLYAARDIDIGWQLGPKAIRMSLNENTYPPSPRVLEAIEASLERINIYPPHDEIKKAAAKYAERRPEEVVVGFGSSEMIDACVRAFVNPGEEALIPIPTYEQYVYRLGLVEGKTSFVKMSPPDFQYDVEAIEKAITPRTKIVFIASPNNPTGVVASPQDVARLASHNVLVVVDGAYEEFAVKPLFLDKDLRKLENLVFIKTMSKAFGLAGLRLGFALAHEAIASALERAKVVWDISIPALYAGIAALSDVEYMRQTVSRIRLERERLSKELAKIPGVNPFPSEANFILVDIKDTGKTGKQIRTELEKHAILIKDATTTNGIDGLPYLRISVATPEQDDVLLKILREFLRTKK